MRSKNQTRAAAIAIGVIWWVSLAVVVVVSGLLILVAAHAVRGGALKLDSFFELPSTAYRISAHKLSGSAATLGLSASSLSFARPRLGFVLVCAVVLAVAAGVWLYIVHQLRALLAALRAGATFASQNEVRLRRVGVAVIAFELGHALAVWGGRHVSRARAGRARCRPALAFCRQCDCDPARAAVARTRRGVPGWL